MAVAILTSVFVETLFGGALLMWFWPMRSRASFAHRQIGPKREYKMRQPPRLLLLLALAGCTSGGDLFHQSQPTKPTASATEPVLQGPPQQAVPRSNLSPAATAAAPPDATGGKGELMECVTQSCRINCSPKIARRFRPKWCANFKEPTE